ncbi:MAG: ATP-binding protein [Microcoleaceae cyanobacterium]
MKKALTLDSKLQDLTLHAAYLESKCSTQEVAQLFKANPQLPGVIILHGGKFMGMISRRRYFEFMSRPYSLDLFLSRPLFQFYRFAKIKFLILNSQRSIAAAIKFLFKQSRQLIYEPIVVKTYSQAYQVLDVYELLLAQLKISDLTEGIMQHTQDQLQIQTQQLEDAIYQLQRTQTQLIQTEKMSSLGQLVAGIAHEINNPVSFIHGNLFYGERYVQDLVELVQLYQRHYPQPTAEIQDKIEEIDLEFLTQDVSNIFSSMKSGTERIRNMVLSLRNFGRLDEAGVKRVNIHEGLDSTLLILNDRLNSHGNRLEKIVVEKKYDDLPLIECSPGQINQVFMNILNNAIDSLDEAFSRVMMSGLDPTELDETPSQNSPSPQLKIWTKKIDQSRISIWIADNGLGMTQEIKEKLFDPFFTTKPVGSGTGLGLSISYEIVVNQHHGELTCISEVGQGAEFIITLPIQYLRPARESAPYPA